MVYTRAASILLALRSVHLELADSVHSVPVPLLRWSPWAPSYQMCSRISSLCTAMTARAVTARAAQIPFFSWLRCIAACWKRLCRKKPCYTQKFDSLLATIKPHADGALQLADCRSVLNTPLSLNPESLTRSFRPDLCFKFPTLTWQAAARGGTSVPGLHQSRFKVIASIQSDSRSCKKVVGLFCLCYVC